MPEELRSISIIDFYRHIGCDVLQFGNYELLPEERITYPFRYIYEGTEKSTEVVEQILGYDFLRGDFELSPSFCDAAIPEDYTFEYTTSSLRSPRLPIYDSDAMYMLPVTSHLDWNIMSFIFRTSDGRLAVIDGGHPEETEAMLGALTQLSGGETPIVDVWFVTHLHSDHYGVLTELCSDSGKYSGRVKVKKLCHALLPREFYSDISRERGSVPAGAWDVLNNAAATLGCEVVRLAEGDSVSVCGLDFYVLHTPDCVEAGAFTKDEYERLKHGAAPDGRRSAAAFSLGRRMDMQSPAAWQA